MPTNTRLAYLCLHRGRLAAYSLYTFQNYHFQISTYLHFDIEHLTQGQYVMDSLMIREL